MPSGNPSSKTIGLADESQISLLQESLTCGVLIVDSRSRVVDCTPEAADQLGLEPDRVQGLRIESLPPPLPQLLREAVAEGKVFSNRKIPLTKDSNTSFLRASVIPVPQRNEVVVILNHLTSAPVLEQSMRRLDRLASLGTLSAGMAHEIKNGMVAIRTFVELLVEKGQDTELTDVVVRELQRIDLIVSQMLRFASPNPVERIPVRVHDILDHSLRLVEHQINGSLITLNRDYRADPDTVQGDEHQLQQGFMNLLFNAIQAMGANGFLTVSTETVSLPGGERQVRIRVQDSGVGIPPENLDRLFEPFFTTKRNGTGLGLAICRRIIQEHQGSITAQSVVNKGSTFTITLPQLA